MKIIKYNLISIIIAVCVLCITSPIVAAELELMYICDDHSTYHVSGTESAPLSDDIYCMKIYAYGCYDKCSYCDYTDSSAYGVLHLHHMQRHAFQLVGGVTECTLCGYYIP